MTDLLTTKKFEDWPDPDTVCQDEYTAIYEMTAAVLNNYRKCLTNLEALEELEEEILRETLENFRQLAQALLAGAM